MTKKQDLFNKRYQQKDEWNYWAKRIGQGTREEQMEALKNERVAYKKLLELEAKIREGV